MRYRDPRDVRDGDRYRHARDDERSPRDYDRRTGARDGDRSAPSRPREDHYNDRTRSTSREPSRSDARSDQADSRRGDVGRRAGSDDGAGNEVQEELGAEDDDEEAAMAAMLGFGGFGSTKVSVTPLHRDT